MSQITIYLPDAVEHKVRKVAKANGKSVSRWIADQVLHNLSDVWPKGVLDAAGALPDFPSLEEVRRGYGDDVPREPVE